MSQRHTKKLVFAVTSVFIELGENPFIVYTYILKAINFMVIYLLPDKDRFL